MIYKILIKGENSAYAFATDKKEITESKVIVDSEGNETIEHILTGKFKTVIFETEDVEELKAKYISLMDVYKKSQLNAIADVQEIVTIKVDVEEVNSTPSEENPTDDNCNCIQDNLANKEEIESIFDKTETDEDEV